MQNNRKPLLRHRSKFSQLILLNEQAQIVSSCDSIFTASTFKNDQVTDWFPFMESIFPSLWSMMTNQPNISFNKMQTPIPELPGIYDFTFSKVSIEHEAFILWNIYDFTDLYEDFRQFQQRKNELEIHRETLERRYQSLIHKDDIKIQHNIIIERLDHLQLTYFNKIKSALLAPVNGLDGITFLLAKSLENKEKKYLQQLRITLKQLSLILDELEITNTTNLPAFSQENFKLIDLFIELTSIIPSKPSSLKYSIDEKIPEVINGNSLYLKQTLFGIIINATNLHPKSSFEVKVKLLERQGHNLKIQFQLLEYLNAKSVLLSEEDYSILIYRLSIVKQLIDLQRGHIYVDKNPKDLSISINFDLNYTC